MPSCVPFCAAEVPLQNRAFGCGTAALGFQHFLFDKQIAKLIEQGLGPDNIGNLRGMNGTSDKVSVDTIRSVVLPPAGDSIKALVRGLIVAERL